jgi:hypothetical protein
VVSSKERIGLRGNSFGCASDGILLAPVLCGQAKADGYTIVAMTRANFGVCCLVNRMSEGRARCQGRCTCNDEATRQRNVYPQHRLRPDLIYSTAKGA